MEIIEVKTVRTETNKRVELRDNDLRKLIKTATGYDLPMKAEIYVEVPGGGDWSNTSLDISEAPVIITWTEVTEE